MQQTTIQLHLTQRLLQLGFSSRRQTDDRSSDSQTTFSGGRINHMVGMHLQADEGGEGEGGAGEVGAAAGGLPAAAH